MPLDPLPDWVLARRQRVGKRIRDARTDAKLTQIRLGELVGLDHKTIHRIEYGYTDPSLTDLLLIAAVLKKPLADLLD